MNFRNHIKARNEKRSPAAAIGLALAMMYVVSGVVLLGLAVLLYNFELSEATIKIGVVATYILSGFVGGFWMGKQMQDKKYLWGMAIGSIYFVVLCGLSFVIKAGTGETLSFEWIRMITTLALCAVSGMAGGMIS